MKKVIELAASERRLLLTEDKDFGQLVFAAAKESSSVILIRSPALQLERTQASPGDHSVSYVARLRPGSMTTKRLESAPASSASSFTTASASVEQPVARRSSRSKAHLLRLA
jgi:hypothetical protein